MFEKICIKAEALQGENINIPFLIDTMLYYGEVNVIGHENDIICLLQAFGEDLLTRFILQGRIKLHISQSLFVPGVYYDPYGDDDYFTIECTKGTKNTIPEILYSAYQHLAHNSTKSLKFSDAFSEIVDAHVFESIVAEMVVNDFQNTDYLSKVAKEVLRSWEPEYKPDKPIRIEIHKNNTTAYPTDTYSVRSNIDFDTINTKRLNRKEWPMLSHGHIMQELIKSRGDNYISAQYESELATDSLTSTLICYQLTDVINRTQKSEAEIVAFQKHILTGYPSIGNAYITKQIDAKQLLKIMEESDRFRDWLRSIPADTDLINRYVTEALAPTLADKKVAKIARFAINVMSGFVPVLGTVTSFTDTFFVDKLINGWKPNHFIDKKLKNLLTSTNHKES